MVAAVVVPMIISQNYIEKSSFDLVEIDTVNQIHELTNEKYFKVSFFQVDRNSSLHYVTVRTSGRNNDNLIFYLYLSSPFESTINIWYGLEYSKKVSNRISDNRKDSEYRSFLEKSESEFESFDFQDLEYFEKLGYSDDRDGFLEAIKETNPQLNKKKQVILVPKYDDFEQRLGNTFPWIFVSYCIGALVLLIMVVFPKIDQK